MKITDVKAIYPKYQHVVPSWRTHFWQIVVRVDTDSGEFGYGYGGGGIASVEIVNRHFKELLMGRDINDTPDIEGIWDFLYDASMPYGRKGLALMALSGLDLALWDLLGRTQNKPVYELLGGLNKPKIHAYATGNDTALYKELGYTANKFSHRWTGAYSDYDVAVESCAKAREIMGQEATLMIDTYMSWDSKVTQEMGRQLKEFNLYWFEDVLTPDKLLEQSELRPLVKPTLIAGGEHEFSHHGFADIARAEALDLWQPDITWCGGITAGLRITEMGKAAGIPVCPHRGGEVWGLHLLASSDWADFAEFHSDHIRGERDILWLDEPEPKDGYISPTDAPGFGVRLNESLL